MAESGMRTAHKLSLLHWFLCFERQRGLHVLLT